MHFVISFLQILLFHYTHSLSAEESAQLVQGSSTDHRENSGSTEEFRFINQKSFDKANQYVFLNYCCWIMHDIGRINKQHSVDNTNVVTMRQTYQTYQFIVDTNEKRLSLLMKSVILHGTFKNCVCGTKINYMTKKDEKLFMTCRKFNDSDLKHLICDNLIQRNRGKLGNNVLYKNRRLLEHPSGTEDYTKQDADDVIHLWIGGVDGKSYIVKNSTFIGLSASQWKEFLKGLREKTSATESHTCNRAGNHVVRNDRDREKKLRLSLIEGALYRSRDHVWAMLCLVGLVFVMVAGMKLCGLKTINRQHEIYQENMFRDSSHTVSIKEILALKRPYLPKGLVKFQKRWRGKSRKKMEKEKIVERDIADPMSDNSDEERIIYSQPIIEL